jgi:P27 family predicted phage terminase small subunit
MEIEPMEVIEPNDKPPPRRGRHPRKRVILKLTQQWDPPSHLSDLAKQEFEHCVDLLTQRGTLDRTDARLVLDYAMTAETIDACYRAMQEGLVDVSDRKNRSVSPHAKLWLSAMQHRSRLAELMGLTPKAKTSQPIDTTGGFGRWARLLPARG